MIRIGKYSYIEPYKNQRYVKVLIIIVFIFAAIFALYQKEYMLFCINLTAFIMHLLLIISAFKKVVQ